MKKWITFDLDGTLMQNPFGEWVFPELNATVSRWAGTSVNIVRGLLEEHQRRMRAAQYVAAYDWDEMLTGLLEKLHIEQRLDIEELVIKHAVPGKIRLLEEGSVEVLGRLREAGFSLAAVTNGFFKYQFPVMEALGLSGYFDEIVTPERAGAGKPDPAILRMFGGNVVAHIGDRLDHDVKLANDYGCLSVFVYHNLPRALLSVHPSERACDASMAGILTEKWEQESSGTANGPLARLCKPKVVVAAVRELLTLEELKKV